jgi:signal transduction histidine kinase
MRARRTTPTAPPAAQLLSLAVHEFRTPASVLGGYLRMLQRDTRAALDDRHRQMIEEAEKSCARLVALFGELNEIAKLDDPATVLVRESFDLFGLVREAAVHARDESDSKVTVELRGRSAGAKLKGDAVRLHAAFSALVRAVLREQADEAVVVVECRLRRVGKRRSAVVIVSARDDLARTAAAAKAPFDDMRGGLGLALPIARRVIERHGGRVSSPPSENGGAGVRGAVVVLVRL